MLVIRNIESKDIDEVTDINIECWKKCYTGIIDKEYLENIDRQNRVINITRAMENNMFIVAEEKERILGSCRYVPNNGFSPNFEEIDAEICALYVDVNFQNKGVGTKLLEYVLEELKKNGKKKVIIWCLKGNEKARLFYSKMGGTVYAERKIKIADKEYDEIAYKYDI